MEKIGTIRFTEGVHGPVIALTIGGKAVPITAFTVSQDCPDSLGFLTVTMHMLALDVEAPGMTGAGAE